MPSNCTPTAAPVGYGIEAFNEANPLAWPNFATIDDLRGLPPTVISVNECDPLRDEGIDFFRRLLAADVPARGRVVLATTHAAELYPTLCPEIAHSTARDLVEFANATDLGARDLAHGYPAALARAARHRFAHRDDLRALFESRRPYARGPGVSPRGRLIDEARVVSHTLTDRPPALSFGMQEVFGSDSSQTVQSRVVVHAAEPELVELAVGKDDGSLGAVDLDDKVAGPTRRHARYFERALYAGGESDQRRRRLVDLDGPGSGGCRSLARKGGRRGDDFVNRTDHPRGEVDQVTTEIRDRRAAHVGLKAPVKGDVGIENSSDSHVPRQS